MQTLEESRVGSLALLRLWSSLLVAPIMLGRLHEHSCCPQQQFMTAVPCAWRCAQCTFGEAALFLHLLSTVNPVKQKAFTGLQWVISLAGLEADSKQPLLGIL